MLFYLLPGSQGNSNRKGVDNMRKDEKGIDFERQRGRCTRNHTCKQPKAVKEKERKKERKKEDKRWKLSTINLVSLFTELALH
jgi:hypothetical protein